MVTNPHVLCQAEPCIDIYTDLDGWTAHLEFGSDIDTVEVREKPGQPQAEFLTTFDSFGVCFVCRDRPRVLSLNEVASTGQCWRP